MQKMWQEAENYFRIIATNSRIGDGFTIAYTLL